VPVRCVPEHRRRHAGRRRGDGVDPCVRLTFC
jgi:hypothetical protein